MKKTMMVGMARYLGLVALAFCFCAAEATSQATQINTGSVQGEAKTIVVPEKDYRQLKKEDGLDFKMSIVQAWFTDGGRKMEGEIDSITFTTPTGKTLPIKLASRSVTGGQIQTVEYGIMYMKPGSAFTAQLFLTEDQINQIKKNIEAEASGK